MPHCRLTALAALMMLGSLALIESCAIHPRSRYTTDRSRASAQQPSASSQGDRDAAGTAIGPDSMALDRSPGARPASSSSVALQPLQNDANHAKLAASISVYLDARYKYGGDDAEAIDCSGFVKAVYEEAYGVTLPRKAAEMYRIGKRVGKSSLATGDLIFFSTAGRRAINHVGIYLSGKKFVHASTSVGVTISSLDEEYWTRRYMGARRLQG